MILDQLSSAQKQWELIAICVCLDVSVHGVFEMTESVVHQRDCADLGLVRRSPPSLKLTARLSKSVFVVSHVTFQTPKALCAQS